MEGKTVNESYTLMTELVLPNDANTHGNVLGGKVMHLMDLAAAVAAMRHCRQAVVTVSVDSVRFHHPVRIGHLMLLEASVTRAFRTSMEVRVKVQSEHPLNGERKTTCTAFLTFVAIDSQGQPAPVPPVIAETKEQKKRYEEALERRRQRLSEDPSR